MMYTRSNGEEVVIEEMKYPHLRSATLKSERMEPGSDQSKALRAELDKREAAYAAEQAAEQQRG